MTSFGFMIEENFSEPSRLPVNVRYMDYDFDQTSGYPSDSVATNLSKTTTSKELISVEGVPKPVFKANNLNLMYGPINSGRYCREMLNAPTFDELLNSVVTHMNKGV